MQLRSLRRLAIYFYFFLLLNSSNSSNAKRITSSISATSTATCTSITGSTTTSTNTTSVPNSTMDSNANADSSQQDDSQQSAWGEGVSLLDSVLEPGSATNVSLSDSQREGLKRLKRLLLTGGDEIMKSYIPRDLARKSLISSSQSSSDQFILANFAGVQRGEVARKKLKSIIAANTFLGRLQCDRTQTLRTKNSGGLYGTYLPSGFTNLPEDKQRQLRDLLSWESIERWRFNIFQLRDLVGDDALVYLGWAVVGSPYAQHAMDQAIKINSDITLHDRSGYRFLEEYKISEETLCSFLKQVQEEYLDMPYHNRYHASDVVQSLHVLLQMNESYKRFSDDKLQIFAIFLSAIIHDLGHPGKSNNFLINTRHELAVLYNDKSVLENMHASKGYELLYGDTNSQLLAGFSKEQAASIRKMVIHSVLQTDMSLHFEKVNQIKGYILEDQEIQKENAATNNAGATQPQTTPMKGDAILSFLLHAADISNAAKAAPVFEMWTDRCLEEFFQQGDKEKELDLPVSPLCDRDTTSKPESQIGFIKYIILPTFELLGTCIPNVKEQIVPIIQDNLQYWIEQKELEEDATTSTKKRKNNGKSTSVDNAKENGKDIGIEEPAPSQKKSKNDF